MVKPFANSSLTISLADQLFAQTKSVGIFNLSLGLVEHLGRRPELTPLTVLANYSLTSRLPESLDVRWHTAPTRGRWGRIWWDQLGVYAAAARTGNEWLFLPKGFASFTRACPQRLAACVADTIHDHYRVHYPQAVKPLEQWYFVRSFWGTVRHAEVIFTISDFTRDEVIRLTRARGLTPPLVHPMGIGFERPQAAPEAARRGVLVLASPFPHKRTELALDWLARWQQQKGFSGEVTWVGRPPAHLARPSFARWRWHDRLPEAEYRALLARSEALVFFSDYEGFGMPPVEAALAGACPVFSAIPATREVMGDCGCAFSNGDYESFRVAMDAALGVSREQVVAWAEELRARHNWGLVTDRFVAGLRAARAQCP
jgi:glycosyltransferase involved in cell wall biosynthesis